MIALHESLSQVERQIAAACRRAGRPRSEVSLMAVTKTRPASAIQEAISLGIRLFGENRVQEFQTKQAELCRQGSSNSAAEFHCIGHLQSNKIGSAVEIFSGIDSLDSLRLAERLNHAAGGRKQRLPVLIEIKLDREAAKSGLAPEARELGDLLERLPNFEWLDLRGLMTVPPYCEDRQAVRPYFVQLRQLRDRLAAAHSGLAFGELSMGMSHDFVVAIEEGATQIRLGTALFGSRGNAIGAGSAAR